MTKKYQVFISSTYTDLIEERKAVEETIIRAGDIPVGMEAFPAADDEQFEFIKSVIDQCDYYILIIAGRYGSLAPDGLSYTEKEFHYAVERGIPVLFMLHGDRGDLARDKSEKGEKGMEFLGAFIEKASTGRIRKNWTTTDGLKLAVREALDHAKATKVRPGWVRGGDSSSVETLARLVQLQEENADLRTRLQVKEQIYEAPKNLAGLDASFTLKGAYTVPDPDPYIGGFRISRSSSLQTSYGEVFELIGPHLLSTKMDSEVNALIFRSLWGRRHGEGGEEKDFSTDDEIFQTLKIQFVALGLVTVESASTAKGRPVLAWDLTEVGKREMFNRRVVPVEA